MLQYLPQQPSSPAARPKQEPFTPLRTEATSHFDSHFQSYSNESIEIQPRQGSNESLFGNESMVSFSSPERQRQEAEDLLRAMRMVRFLAAEVRAKRKAIQQKKGRVCGLTEEREQTQVRISRQKRGLQKRRTSNQSKLRRASASRTQTNRSIDGEIDTLKGKIRGAKRLFQNRCRTEARQDDLNSSINIFLNEGDGANRQLGHRRSQKHRRMHACMDQGARPSQARKHKKKIYVPIVMTMTPFPQGGSPDGWQEPYRNDPTPNRMDQQQYPNHRNISYPAHCPNFPANYVSDHGHYQQSFTAKLNTFADRLEGALTNQYSKKHSDLSVSEARRMKMSAGEAAKGSGDKGSYIYPSMKSSKRSSRVRVSQQREGSRYFSEDDLHEERALKPESGYSKMGYKKTISNTEEGHYECLRADRMRRTQKQDGFPAIEEVNNSTINVSIPSERRDHSSSNDRELLDGVERPPNLSGKGSGKKQKSEQSVVVMESRYLEMLDQSPRKEVSFLTSIPEQFRIMETDGVLGESVNCGSQLAKAVFEPQGSKQLLTPSFPFDSENSVSSKYEETPRRQEADRKQQSSDEQWMKRQSFMLNINLHPLRQESRQTPKFETRSLLTEPDEDDDIMNTIQLSTESIFSREKNRSVLSELKRSDLDAGKDFATASDIKESRKVKNTVAEVQDPARDDQEVMEQMRSAMPSRISRTNLGKQAPKADNQFMAESIAEANQEEEEAVSSKRISKPSKH